MFDVMEIWTTFRIEIEPMALAKYKELLPNLLEAKVGLVVKGQGLAGCGTGRRREKSR